MKELLTVTAKVKATLLKVALLTGMTACLFLLGCSSNKLPEPPESEAPEKTALPNSPGSFYTAKKLLYETVHKGHRKTFYCGCTFSKNRKVDIDGCGVTARKNEKRSRQLEAEHVFPASHFGQHRQCWREKMCTDNNGKAYGGRRCCQRIDPSFEIAHNDLHNLQPSVGEVNGDRSNFRFGIVSGEPRSYGSCDFEVDFKADRAEPPANVHGDIARTYFYMRDMYSINLSDQQTKLFEAWNKIDPVDDWERERNSRIKKIQGIGNKYIE